MRIKQPTRINAPRTSVIILAALVPLLLGASILAWSGQTAGVSSGGSAQPGQKDEREESIGNRKIRMA